MLFLGIISGKGASRFSGGGGFVLQMGGFIFKWMGASVLMGEFPPCPSTMGNPASYVVTLAIEKIPTKAHQISNLQKLLHVM